MTCYIKHSLNDKALICRLYLLLTLKFKLGLFILIYNSEKHINYKNSKGARNTDTLEYCNTVLCDSVSTLKNTVLIFN